MIWFESLLFYGFDEHSALKRGDVDNILLPSIVEKVILSKLTGSYWCRAEHQQANKGTFTVAQLVSVRYSLWAFTRTPHALASVPF